MQGTRAWCVIPAHVKVVFFVVLGGLLPMVQESIWTGLDNAPKRLGSFWTGLLGTLGVFWVCSGNELGGRRVWVVVVTYLTAQPARLVILAMSLADFPLFH
jgi:hypothetical protein